MQWNEGADNLIIFKFRTKYGLGTLAYYINEYSDKWAQLCGQPPCGILNPINVNTYRILEEIYADMLDVFDKDLFHMGGDEVNLESWYKIDELKKWIQGNKGSTMELWKYFQSEAFKRLKKSSENVTAILWTSKLTEGEINDPFLNTNDYIIQVWESMNSMHTRELLRRGFSLILSFVDNMYLDWGFGTWLGRNHDWHFNNWQKIYDVNFGQVNTPNILGGECPLWGEKVGSESLEVRLWPRAFALAEKLWSNPKRRLESVYTRLNYHVYRMRNRGIPVSMLQPESCLHFRGHCRNPTDVI